MASKNNMKETFVNISLFSMDFIPNEKKLPIHLRPNQTVVSSSTHNNLRKLVYNFLSITLLELLSSSLKKSLSKSNNHIK